jgi:serine/threonine protein kinase
MASDVIGKTIAGCKITELIGQGGMGLVYRAHHLALDQDRALKVMDPYIARDESFMKRFQAEARSLAKLRSPYIVTVHDSCETEIGTCLIMEFVNGQTLAEIIKNSPGPLEERRVFHLFRQILMALEHAHGANVIHRDIKPGNILIEEKDVVKVTDFGLAKIQVHGSTTVTQLTGGTIYYMSPEQLEGLGKVDHRGDLYSAGMTLYETLTGLVPFEKTESDFGIREKIVKGRIPPPKIQNPKIRQSLSAFVMKAIACDPSRRFQSATEMRSALEKVEADYFRAEETKKVAQVPAYRKSALPVMAAIVLLVAGYIVYKLFSPEPAVMTIRTNPPGAQIEIDEKVVGRSPIVAYSTLPGTARIRLRKQDFGGKETLLVLRSGDSLNLVFNLKPVLAVANRDTVSQRPSKKEDTVATAPPPRSEPSLLLVTSKPPGANVYVDRVLQRSTPPFQLDPGRHTVRVVSGKNVWEKQIRLVAGKQEQRFVDFTRLVRITVVVNEPNAFGKPDTTRSIPGCRVIVDGVEVASSTPKLIHLPLGTHTITVRHPVYGEAQPLTETFEGDKKVRFVLAREQRD